METSRRNLSLGKWRLTIKHIIIVSSLLSRFVDTLVRSVLKSETEKSDKTPINRVASRPSPKKGGCP